MILALLLELHGAIGRWNLELVLDLLSLERMRTVDQRGEHARFAASWVAKRHNNFLVVSLFNRGKHLFTGRNYILQAEVLVVGLALVPQVGEFVVRLQNRVVRFLKHLVFKKNDYNI